MVLVPCTIVVVDDRDATKMGLVDV